MRVTAKNEEKAKQQAIDGKGQPLEWTEFTTEREVITVEEEQEL